MKTKNILSFCLLGLTLMGAQSCLKSYVEYFDDSSAKRLTTYLGDLDKLLGGEQYGWRMEYFVGNEDGDFGGINLALKFDAEKGEVTAMSEEDGTFGIKIPVYTTALYVYAPEYLPLQVNIVAGDESQRISVKMLGRGQRRTSKRSRATRTSHS